VYSSVSSAASVFCFVSYSHICLSCICFLFCFSSLFSPAAYLLICCFKLLVAASVSHLSLICLSSFSHLSLIFLSSVSHRSLICLSSIFHLSLICLTLIICSFVCLCCIITHLLTYVHSMTCLSCRVHLFHLLCPSVYIWCYCWTICEKCEEEDVCKFKIVQQGQVVVSSLTLQIPQNPSYLS
jgi:hypothetical protein